jgi:hypothetical protein
MKVCDHWSDGGRQSEMGVLFVSWVELATVCYFQMEEDYGWRERMECLMVWMALTVHC